VVVSNAGIPLVSVVLLRHALVLGRRRPSVASRVVLFPVAMMWRSSATSAG
jgi:hypothetical protein